MLEIKGRIQYWNGIFLFPSMKFSKKGFKKSLPTCKVLILGWQEEILGYIARKREMPRQGQVW